MTKETQNDYRFSDLGIAAKLLGVLERQKFIKPTPIQHQCIPVALEGKDVVGIAQTGTGKTMAFAIPMIQKIAEHKGQGLILLPTRELALQVNDVLKKIGSPIGLQTAVIIGGESSRNQIHSLRRNPHIVVSTPGRLIDLMGQKKYTLDKVRVIVLDEADRMLDIGFMPAIKEILSHAPQNRQTLMFSATIPAEIAEIASSYMKMPLRIEVAPSGTAAKNVEQELFFVAKEAKNQLLDMLLTETTGSVLIFSRTKFGAKKIAANVTDMGYSATDIHSNKSLIQRKKALEGFRSGRYRVLVATDIASRGIDVNNISLVINYDLPENCEDYVHRIGRTGRAGKLGKAISFATPSQRRDIKKIEFLIKKSIPVKTLPILPPRRTTSVAFKSENHNQNRQHGHDSHKSQGKRDSYKKHNRGGKHKKNSRPFGKSKRNFKKY